MRRLDARRYFRARCVSRTRRLGRVQRTRPRYRARHQHVADTLMPEIAIGEAHTGHRALKAAVVLLDQIEAGFEGNALQRGAYRLAAHLQRIAGKANMAHRTCARELYRAGGAAIVQDAAGATGAVEAPEREYLARDESARFVGIHGLSGERRASR